MDGWNHPFVRLLALVALVGLVACSGSQKKKDEEASGPQFDDRKLQYSVAHTDGRLRVAVTFRGAESGESTFALPNRRGSQGELYKGVKDFRVQGENVEISEGEKPHLRVLEHEPKAVLKVRYAVDQTFESEYRENRFRPIVQKDAAFFIGRTVLGYPERMRVGLERPIVFDWSGLDEGDRAVHSFGQVQGGETDQQSLETALGAVRNGLYLVGDVEVGQMTIRDSEVHFAGFGALPVEPGALSKPVGTIIKAQRKFWDDFDVPPYLVGMYGVDDCCWSVGDAVYHGFASILAQQEPRSMRSHVVQLVAHEHLHRWIPDKLGSPRPFRAYLWFIEGFTEHYARRFKLRTGFLDYETLVQKVNGTIESYWNSTVREAERAKVQKGFRKQPDLTQLPYQRGELMALNWNARIRKATDGEKSLDDVMRSLQDKHASDEEFRVSDETLAKTVKEVAPGVDVSSEITSVLDEGGTVEISKRALGPCATLKKGSGASPPSFEIDEKKAESNDCTAWFK